MFISVLKDTIIIFLLIFAVLQLAEKLVLILSSRWEKTELNTRNFYVLDLTQIPYQHLECFIRSKLPSCQGLTYLITDFSEEKSNEILAKLCNQYTHLCPLTRSELLRLLGEKAVPDVSLQGESRAVPGQDK